MREESEKVRQRFLGIRDRLKALRESITKKQEQEIDPVNDSDVVKAGKLRRKEMLEKRMMDHFKSVAEDLEKLQFEKDEFSTVVDQNQSLEADEAYQRYVDLEMMLFGDIALDKSVTVNELLEMLTDGAVQVVDNPANIRKISDVAIGDPLLGPEVFKIDASHLDDEIKGLGELREFKEKAHEGISNLYNKLPKGVRETLAGIGIGVNEFVTMVINFIADFMENYSFLRGMSMSLRSYAAERKAKSQGISQEAIDKAKEKWKPLYMEWGKRKAENPSLTEEPPDLFAMIEAESKGVELENRREQAAKANEPHKEVFKQYAIAHDELFGVKIDQVEPQGSAFSGERLPSGNWKVQIPTEGFIKNNDGSFSLDYESKTLKSLLGVAGGITEIKHVRVDSFTHVTTDTVLYNEESQLTDAQLKNLVDMRKIGADKWEEVRLKEGGDTEVERSQGNLMIPKEHLDDPGMLAQLRTAVNAADRDTPVIRWDVSGAGGSWTKVFPPATPPAQPATAPGAVPPAPAI
ncbi:hypothetical protein KJ996_03220 [Patescibacteria group bacterium]|nr:hypothetical protein [Patescibacteria group bacterium]